MLKLIKMILLIGIGFLGREGSVIASSFHKFLECPTHSALTVLKNLRSFTVLSSFAHRPYYLEHQEDPKDYFGLSAKIVVKMTPYYVDPHIFSEGGKRGRFVSHWEKRVPMLYKRYYLPHHKTLTYIETPVFALEEMQPPCLTCVEKISSLEDILIISKYLKDYHNYMMQYFLQTQSVLRYWPGQHLNDMQLQASLLLDLVRPLGKMQSVQERVKDYIESALCQNLWNLSIAYFNQFCLLYSPRAFGGFERVPVIYYAPHPNYQELYPKLVRIHSFDYEQSVIWQPWISVHRDLSDHAFFLLKLIWGTSIPASLQVFSCQKEFEEALIRVDSSFGEVI